MIQINYLRSFMYLIVIAWIYVVLMMAVAEATNSSGTVLGAVVTFLVYGVGPAGLVAYLMGAPARNKRNKKLRAEEWALAQQSAAPGHLDTPARSVEPPVEPDAGGHAARGEEAITGDTSIAPVRKET